MSLQENGLRSSLSFEVCCEQLYLCLCRVLVYINFVLVALSLFYILFPFVTASIVLVDDTLLSSAVMASKEKESKGLNLGCLRHLVVSSSMPCPEATTRFMASFRFAGLSAEVCLSINMECVIIILIKSSLCCNLSLCGSCLVYFYLSPFPFPFPISLSLLFFSRSLPNTFLTLFARYHYAIPRLLSLSCALSKEVRYVLASGR